MSGTNDTAGCLQTICEIHLSCHSFLIPFLGFETAWSGSALPDKTPKRFLTRMALNEVKVGRISQDIGHNGSPADYQGSDI